MPTCHYCGQALADRFVTKRLFPATDAACQRAKEGAQRRQEAEDALEARRRGTSAEAVRNERLLREAREGIRLHRAGLGQVTRHFAEVQVPRCKWCRRRKGLFNVGCVCLALPGLLLLPFLAVGAVWLANGGAISREEQQAAAGAGVGAYFLLLLGSFIAWAVVVWRRVPRFRWLWVTEQDYQPVRDLLAEGWRLEK
jgi:hypothetical protein